MVGAGGLVNRWVKVGFVYYMYVVKLLFVEGYSAALGEPYVEHRA